MSDNLADAMGKLRQLSGRLNRASDEATAAVRAVEKFLVEECKVGVYANAIFSTETFGSGFTAYESLVFCKIAGKWRIGVEYSNDLDNESGEITAWDECPRDVKLQAIPSLPDLIAKVIAVLEDRASAAEESARVTTQVIASLAKRGA